MVSNRVAILVAHGIGRQQPFETLDKVAAGIAHSVERKFPEISLTFSHGVRNIRETGDDWRASARSGRP